MSALTDPEDFRPIEVTGSLTVDQVRDRLNAMYEFHPTLLEHSGRRFLLRWAQLQDKPDR